MFSVIKLVLLLLQFLKKDLELFTTSFHTALTFFQVYSIFNFKTLQLLRLFFGKWEENGKVFSREYETYQIRHCVKLFF